MNRQENIKSFFEKGRDHYLNAWKEGFAPDFPVMHILKRDRDEKNKYSIGIVPLTVPGGLPHKVSPLSLVKPIIRDMKPDAYIVFSEAWCVDSNQLEKSVNTLEHGDLEYMKHRKERLIIVGNSIDNKEHFQEFYTIKRDFRTMKKWLELDNKNTKAKLSSTKLP